jgi:TPP-dependent pyruvate/acetoin dehydrogenase alpha subunit
MRRARLLAMRAEAQLGRCFASALGLEAATVAVAIDLLGEDAVVASPFDLLPGFVKGLTVKQILELASQLRTGKDGPTIQWSNASRNVLFLSSSLAERLHIAVGMALADKVKSNARIVTIFTGPESASSEIWADTLTFAGRHELPILFICQNTLLAAPSPQEKISELAKILGTPGIAVDGMDAVAVYRVACESISRARLGRGPTVIDCQRFCIEDQPAALRGKGVSKSAAEDASVFQLEMEDPIANMKNYLERKALWKQDFDEQLLAEFEKELESVTEFRQAASMEEKDSELTKVETSKGEPVNLPGLISPTFSSVPGS